METIAELFSARMAVVRDVDGDETRFLWAAHGALHLTSNTPSSRHAACRVAVLFPQGATLAGALVGTMSAGTAVPLNAKLTVDDLTFAMRDAGVDILLTDPTANQAANACRAAGALGIPIRSLTERHSGAVTDANADDIALLLHTSGTTARPKLVPLTHRNLLASAAAVATAMTLTIDDHGLAVMPLFHIHGIVGSLLSSLWAGSALTVSPFEPLRLQSALVQSRATWMSAVPTMYQAMLARPAIAPSTSLRRLRSSSSTLPLSTWRQLEDRFGCTVVNSYGMTEAAHQMCSTARLADDAEFGTVGRAAGPEVAIAVDGRVVQHGEGEVLVRGSSITSGYLSPREANADSFIDGWFRTGDIGTLALDGCLTLRGRMKELINVGGEKVSPFEVDDVLLAHPAVAEAVSFAAPSDILGEVVHAVVTLFDDVDESELRRHAKDRLARFKVPARIHVVHEIPKGPTGKVQRIRLASQLGVDDDHA